MKAISLPINVVVIIAIALLIMVALALFFTSGYSPASSKMSDVAALNRGCADVIAKGWCTPTHELYDDFSIPGYGFFSTACQRVLGIEDISNCIDYCCKGSMATTTRYTTII